MRFATAAGALLAGLMVLPALAQTATDEERPAFINYGAQASIRQGDPDHHQAIYLSVPATTTGPLYVRLFDPDTTNFFDQMDKKYSYTRTKFAVFGGPGAYIPNPSDAGSLTKEELTAGTKIAEEFYGISRRTDAKWVTLTQLDPATGEKVGDRIIWRLVVDALTGVNGNVYDVALSTSPDDNVAPEGLKLFSYTPTVRMPRRGVETELRFMIPPDATSLNIANFDAAYGESFLTTKLVSYPLVASGQGTWSVTNVTLLPRDIGQEAAVTLSGGDEYPNDASFYVTDDKGRLLSFDVPPHVWDLNKRPVPIATSDPKGTCTTVTFDGSKSYDPEGETLTYTWRFGDGESAPGVTATHEYKDEGRFDATLEVVGTAPQLGNGAPATLSVFVKKPPIAHSVERPLVAAGEANTYDGSPSTASKWKVVRQTWDFGDGTPVAEGESVSHTFAKPGTHTVTHAVFDDSGHPCNTSSEQFKVRVNAQPVAEAGPDQRVSVEQEVVFDAGKSTDSDGKIVAYDWDFGDGAKASGQAVRHRYAKSGTYTVHLGIRDDSDVANSGAEDTLTVIVNDPPISIPGPDQLVAINQVVDFDGSQSFDRDGKIVGYQWNFGDGATATGAKVSHAYAKSGTYTVTLGVKDDSTTNTDTVTHTMSVRVNEPPVAVAGPDQHVAVGQVTHFDAGKSRDPDGKIVAYDWDFGDGSKGSGETVSHQYDKPGTYDVRLDIRDDSNVGNSGATDALKIYVNDPPVPVPGPSHLVAIGETINFDAAKSLDHDGKIIAYGWDFGDGATATGPKVSHAYAKSGTYTVTLTVKDDSTTYTDTVRATTTVRVNEPPVAEAGPDQHVSIKQEVTFDAGKSVDPDGKLVAYEWDFGDGAKGTGRVIRHRYAKAGTYKVGLTIHDDSNVGNSSAVDGLTIFVNDPPIPVPGADKSIAIGETTTFDGGGSKDNDGKIIAYRWDFGDGATGNGVKVDHAYAKSGTYTVTLAVKDDSTTDTDTVSKTMKVRVNEPPVARAGPDQLVTASLVQFDGSASSDLDDSIAKWEWDFGDGSTGTGPKPSHVYAKPGTYVVRLTVTDASGTIRSSASDDLKIVVNAVPIADAGPDLVGMPGEKLTFDASRSLDPDGSVAEYDWDFHDGSMAHGKIAQHAFDKSGTYTVTLKVKDNTGQDAAVDYAETTAFINAPPHADAGPDVLAAPGQPVHLSAAKSFDPDGKIASYRWDFSDSKQPVEGMEVTRTFAAPGVYSAQLTVTDDSGADNSIATDTVRIAINHTPVADPGPDIVASLSTIVFDGTKSVDADGDALSYAWDFGDGSKATGPVVTHTYAQGGTYPVVLVVDDGTKLSNASSQAAIAVKINRPPRAIAGKNQQVCTGDIVVFDGSQSSDPEGGVLRYSWNFGDGTTSDIVNPTKTYSKGGNYPVTLTVKDDSGLTNGQDSAQVAVRVDQGPLAHAGKNIVACAKTEVTFDGSASTDVDGVVNSFSWDFGDAGFGAGEKPTHIYEKPGDYRVFLKIEGEKVGICDSTSTDEIQAKIIEGPVAVIKAPNSAPVSDSVTFDGSGSSMTDGHLVGWDWDFGDGTKASGAKVTHRYAKSGAYQVSMTLTSDSPSPSCKVISANHLITINAPPVADAGKDQHVAVDEEALLSGAASHDPDGAIVSYDWDFGDGAKASGVEARHRYTKAGVYTAKLTVNDGANLPNSVATDTVTVTVSAPPAPSISGPEVACIDENVAWKAGGPAGDPVDPGTAYSWSFGDGGTAQETSSNHAFSKAGWYSLSLIENDGKKLPNSVQQFTSLFHVNAPPHADAGPDQLVCPGDTVKFDGSGSSDPDGMLRKFHWDFGDGKTQDGEKVSHVYAKPGTYTVTLAVTDDAGSSCSTKTATMKVIVNAPPIADAGKDRDVFIGGANDAVLLDASASKDPDGTALDYSWEIGDGGSETGQRVRHTFTTVGDFPVTLTVTDTSGLACGVTSTTIHIHARQRN